MKTTPSQKIGEAIKNDAKTVTAGMRGMADCRTVTITVGIHTK
jgi:hypothetical protein